jgi:hypothetical protein
MAALAMLDLFDTKVVYAGRRRVRVSFLKSRRRWCTIRSTSANLRHAKDVEAARIGQK